MYAKIENNKVVYPPRNAGNIFNVDKNPLWLQENGYIDMTEQQLSPYRARQDFTLFNTSCQLFKSVCSQISQATGIENFRGGFDQYNLFITSEFAQQNPAQAALLASMWSGANEYAKYEGSKVGLGQPDWWYRCWNMERGGLNA